MHHLHTRDARTEGQMMKTPALPTLLLSLCFLVPGLSAQAGQTVWLSSLDLSWVTQGWGEPEANQSVGRHPLTLKGQVYRHGLGTHSPGLIVIDLKGGSDRFSAIVGIDDEVPRGKGSAEFEVLSPKKNVLWPILWRSGVMRRGDAPKRVDLDTKGLSQIALRVTTGGDGFDYDHADWADAKFDVSGPAPQTTVWTSRQLSIDTSPAPEPPEIHAPFIVGVRTGTPLIWTVPVSGERPLSFSANSLPEGLALNPMTGTLTGTLLKSGDYPIRITVESHAGHDEHVIHVVAGEKIALTPPMGWNSYDSFGDNVTEEEVMANARYLATKMQPFGWDTVVVDYRWYDPGAHDNNPNGRRGAKLAMDAFGRLLPAPNRFPSTAVGEGFKPMADRIHALGLKFGIHIMRGIPRNAVKANLPINGSDFTALAAANTNNNCPWCPDMFGVRGNTPAGQAYYDSIFRLYASWGVDYVKMDDTSSPYHKDEIEAVRRAIDKCGRSIVFSLSPGETPFADAAHVVRHANLWRVSGDFWDNWGSLDHEFTLGKRWQDYPGPGHWPDADMLPLGHLSIHGRSVGPDRRTHFTRNEQISLLSLWALLPSPLMMDGNLPDNDPWTLALLTNPEVLAVSQDALGAAGHPVTQSADSAIWSRKLADGSIAVGLFNRGDLDQSLRVNWSQLGLSGPYHLRDLWLRKDLGRADRGFQATVPGHGAILLKVSRADLRF